MLRLSMMLALIVSAFGAAAKETSPIKLDFAPVDSALYFYVDQKNLELSKTPKEDGQRWYLEVHRFTDEWVRYVNESQIVGAEGEKGRSYEKFFVSRAKAYERIQLHRLQIWRNGNLVHEQTNGQLSAEKIDIDRGRMYFNTDELIAFGPKDLRTGDEVRAEYSIIGHNPIFEIPFGYSTPPNWSVEKWQLKVIVPSQLNLKQNSYNWNPAFTEHLNGAEKVLSWTVEAYQGWTPEGDTPQPEQLDQPAVLFSAFADWTQMTQWAIKMFPGKEELRQELKSVVEKKWRALPTEKQKLQEIAHFVQHDIRYFAVLWGASAQRPRSANNTFLQQYGDCKDKVNLLRQLLWEVGIESEPVLVNSTLKHGVSKRIAMPLFDHVVLRAHADGLDWFIDATDNSNEDSTALDGRIPFEIGLVLSASSTKLVQIPASENRRMEVDILELATFTDSGAKFKIKEKLIGLPVKNLESIAKNISNDEDFRRQRFKSGFAQYGMTEIVTNVSAEKNTLIYDTEFEPELLTLKSDGEQKYQGGLFRAAAYLNLPKKDRAKSLLVDDWRSLRWKQRIQHDGKKCVPSFKLEQTATASLKISATATTEENVCIFELTIDYLTTEISTKELSAYREVIQQLRALQLLQWRFEEITETSNLTGSQL